MINASAAILLKKPEFQAMSWIRTHDLSVTGAMLRSTCTTELCPLINILGKS